MAAALLTLAQACSCNPPHKLTQAPGAYKIVSGSPSVKANAPSVEINTTPPPVQYQINIPRQCDIFEQNTVRSVDILWMVDSSGSMAPHQAQLANNFQSFITFLLNAQPPIDFHIGVITTDADDPNEQGRLHGWSLNGNSANYIACDAHQNCNTAPGPGNPTQSVQDAFTQMATVGTQGSALERGLYTSYLALNRDENKDHGDGGFIRDSAALYVVYVSDEDDESCDPPIVKPPAGSSCVADPGCYCDTGASNFIGSTEFFVQFLKTYKGYGNGNLVAAAAITGVEGYPVQSQFGDPNPHVGCQGTYTDNNGTNYAFNAYQGQRYMAVANATGGVATSICSPNFNTALSNLGYAVSGLRSDFNLSRGPDTSSLQVFVTPSQSNPNYATCTYDNECVTYAPYTSCQAGKCSEPVNLSIQPDPNSAQYVRCENGNLRNLVRFGSGVIPPALGSVEVCYNVASNFDAVCQ
jgi:hypothetical protein